MRDGTLARQRMHKVRTALLAPPRPNGRGHEPRGALPELPAKAQVTDDEPLDLLWGRAWQTLGQAVHWEAHFYLSRRGRGDLPEPRTGSFIRMGGRTHDSFPDPALVDSIDRRAGRLDWQIGEYHRMQQAVEQLYIYDPIMAEIVELICIEGRTTLLPGRRVRHHTWEGAVRLAPFAEDLTKLQAWLRRSWEGLGILLATPANFKKALAANAVDRGVLDALQRLQLVPEL